MGDELTDGKSTDAPVYLFPNVMSLNVGGKHFATRLSTLRRYPESMLAVMFSGRHAVDTDSQGNYFIDRDGTHFHHILNFLRHDDLPPPDVSESVMKDASYYGIESLAQTLKHSPALFSEYVVRRNIRDKLESYYDIKEDIMSLAKDQVEDHGVVQSIVSLVTTKNQPIPRDLQFSNKVYKQYYRRFKTHKTFEECIGKYYIQVPADKVKGQPDAVMDEISSCIMHDFVREGYHGHCRSESIYDAHRIKTVTWCDEEFHVISSIHVFTFNWLEGDKLHSAQHRHSSANFDPH